MLDIYRKLQQHLDKMPIGFPVAESGMDIRILKHFFTPEEAEIALKLKFLPTSLKKIFHKVKNNIMNIEELEVILDRMANKGSIHYFKKNEEYGIVKYYYNAFLAVGMFEYKLNNLSREFSEDYEQYMAEAYLKEMTRTKIPQLRTIPIDENVTIEHQISTYDDARKIIEDVKGPISIANCVCRQNKDILDQPCKATNLREICLHFRLSSKIYLEKGLSREISKEEALKILEIAEKEGLVLQPSNSQKPETICCCCGCCCEYLGRKKTLPNPVDFFATNFYSVVDSDLCTGCGTCIDRCQMEACTLVDDISTINLNRCIGCGLCVLTCPSKAISLHKKEKESIPPENTLDTYMKIMEKKNKMQFEKK